VAVTGGDAGQISIGSQAGSNAAANNYLNHPDAVRVRQLAEACKAQCTPAQREELADLLVKDKATTELLNSCAGVKSTMCDGVRNDFASAAQSFLPTNEEIWTWARKQAEASGGKYTAAQIYDAYETSFMPGAIPNLTVGDLTAVTDWMRGRIVGDGTLSNPGEAPLSTIAMGWAVGNYASAQGALGSMTLAVAGAIRAGSQAASALRTPLTNLGPEKRLDELATLFDKQNATEQISLNGKTYKATTEGNRSGTTKVFDTSKLPDGELEAQAKAYVSDLTGGAPLKPVAGNPPNVWSASMADGTVVNVRSVSSSAIGNTGRTARWTIDIQNNPTLQNLGTRFTRAEVKFK
jgi:hypothetical protein